MSSSNATHVRLLNASLDSEGLYACEISSQNLSTIKHEREIKVYGEFIERLALLVVVVVMVAFLGVDHHQRVKLTLILL